MKPWPALVGMLALQGVAVAHPLEDATYEAMVRCGVVGAPTIEACGDSALKSPEHSAARKAVFRMFTARTAFMRECQQSESLTACGYRADWLIWGGFNRALEEEASQQSAAHKAQK